jgi:hypothetical protein
MNEASSLTEVFSRLSNQEMAEIGVLPFLFLLAISAAAAMFVSLLYTYFYSSRSTGSEIQRAFPILGISITAIFICIQFSLPLSLGLLGALSIVRFRTPVKEPEEIGFIMLVIATSLASATFSLGFLGMILIAAVATLLIKQAAGPLFSRRRDSGVLMVTLPRKTYTESVDKILHSVRSVAKKGHLESVSQNDSTAVLTFFFRGLPSDRVAQLEQLLGDIDAEIESSLVFSTVSSA